jgi:hypothetical protein
LTDVLSGVGLSDTRRILPEERRGHGGCSNSR